MSTTNTQPGLLHSALRHPAFVIGLVLSLTFILAALVSFVWTPFDPEKLTISAKLQSPTAINWFGTDHFGRDIFSMLMVGARVSIAVAFVAVGIGIIIGVPLGLYAAANRGSLTDEIVMRGNDLIFAFPSLLLAILITAVFGPGAVNAIIAIGIFNIPVFARLARGSALALWTREFVLAARSIGTPPRRMISRHILPNVMSAILVSATLGIANAIITESALSFLGLGFPPDFPTWGRLLYDSTDYLQQNPERVIWPGLAISLTVLAVNYIGDGLRDALDPRIRGR